MNKLLIVVSFLALGSAGLGNQDDYKSLYQDLPNFNALIQHIVDRKNADLTWILVQSSFDFYNLGTKTEKSFDWFNGTVVGYGYIPEGGKGALLGLDLLLTFVPGQGSYGQMTKKDYENSRSNIIHKYQYNDPTRKSILKKLCQYYNLSLDFKNKDKPTTEIKSDPNGDQLKQIEDQKSISPYLFVNDTDQIFTKDVIKEENTLTKELNKIDRLLGHCQTLNFQLEQAANVDLAYWEEFKKKDSYTSIKKALNKLEANTLIGYMEKLTKENVDLALNEVAALQDNLLAQRNETDKKIQAEYEKLEEVRKSVYAKSQVVAFKYAERALTNFMNRRSTDTYAYVDCLKLLSGEKRII